MSEIVVEQKEKLVSDLKTVIADAQELLSLAADQVSESSAEVRGRIQTGLHLSRAKLAHLQEVAVTKAKSAGHATDEYVHENPWKSIGFAAGAGLIIGMLLRRR
jgi:ElaB/YqjD/DUF883 family membrane-anchored ribosome-binding protein